MSRFSAGFLGPQPRWAILPLVAVGAILGWVAARQTADGDGPQPVTALKPIPVDVEETAAREEHDARGVAVAGPAMPIEVRYGVPSPRTARLWSEPRPR